MRIAIINERWTAGATRCARDLERGLRQRHEVCYFPHGERLSPQAQLQQIGEYSPDIVHLHSYYGDLPYSFIKEIATRYPTLVTPHDPRPIGNMMLECWDCGQNLSCFKCPITGRARRYSIIGHRLFLERTRKRLIHAALPQSTRFVAVSEWMRKRMQQTELRRFHIDQVHNGVDLSKHVRDAEARQKLGISPDARVLCFTAHHSGWIADKRKGGHVLAQALEKIVIPKFPKLVVLAVGGGMIPNLPNVKPIGYVEPDSVATYYSASDLFVAPSLADNLPYTVLEAMACEVPVVASRVGGIPEEIEDGVTGKLFTTSSWNELGEAIVSLLELPREQLLHMGKMGRTRVEELFSYSGFVSKYESIFREMVQGK